MQCANVETSKNSQLAVQNPEIINHFIAKELKLGRIEGPFSDAPFPNFIHRI